MTPDQWAMLGAIGEVAGAILTFAGVLTSLYMSIRALREVRVDRRVDKAPFVAFEPGGQRYPIQFEPMNKPDQTGEEPDESHGGWLIQLKRNGDIVLCEYAGLTNYGLGPAIHTQITWVPEKTWIGTEGFVLDEEKLREPKYHAENNTIPAGHLLPGQEATFYRLPAFIRQDFKKKIRRVDGLIRVEYLDLFRQRHVTWQDFHLLTGYEDEPPYIHFTFSDIQAEGTREWPVG